MAREYPKSGARPSSRVVEEAYAVVVEAQPAVYAAAAAIVAAGFADAVSAMKGRNRVDKLEGESWSYVGGRRRAS